MKREQIKSIKYIDEVPEYVYNIEVEGNHNYFVNNILTHNCDDPQNPKMANSEVERKNVIDFYNQTLYSRLNNPELGVRIIVMQRLHEEDLSGYLLANHLPKHEHICIPAEDDVNINPPTLRKNYVNGLFWPNRFTRKVISDFIDSLGSKEAAGQLQQRPAPKGGDIFKREWFDIVSAESIERDIDLEPIMFYIDTAETEKQQGDNTAVACGFKKKGANIVYITNIVRVKKEFHDLVKYIPEFVYKNFYTQNSKIKLEPKSSGKSVVSQLKASTMLNVVELKSPKDDKIARAHATTPICESRRVKFVQGNWVESFMNNLLVFPNGKNDDDVDAFVYLVTDLLMDSDFDFTFI